ncbi:MAG: hypothetical protein DRJ03_05210 [Chloroflexi bacterium]|nr:MAG: hypothetical protein DRJ03_05210 [Chloroflexota bacterium]
MVDITQTLALALTGVAAVPLLQVLKRYLRMGDAPFAWIAYAFSILLAVAASLLTGKIAPQDLADPLVVFGQGSVVFAVSQVVYRSLKEKLGTQGGGKP